MISVIGIVGPIGSGKDTVSDYIAQKYNYSVFSFRDVVREITEKEGFEPTRENLQKVSREFRDKNGEEAFSKIILDKIISSKSQRILVKELRTMGDIKGIWKEFKTNMKIIKVTAPENTRFERMKDRKRISDPQTLEEFKLQQKKEEELGYTKSFDMADFVVFNTGTKEELYSQIDNIMKQLNEDKSLIRRKFL